VPPEGELVINQVANLGSLPDLNRERGRRVSATPRNWGEKNVMGVFFWGWWGLGGGGGFLLVLGWGWGVLGGVCGCRARFLWGVLVSADLKVGIHSLFQVH